MFGKFLAFANSSHMEERWQKGPLHPSDLPQARAQLKINKCKQKYAPHQKVFLPAIIFMSGKIHRAPEAAVDFRRQADKVIL